MSDVQTKCKPPSRLGTNEPFKFNPGFALFGQFVRVLRQSEVQTMPQKSAGYSMKWKTT